MITFRLVAEAALRSPPFHFVAPHDHQMLRAFAVFCDGGGPAPGLLNNSWFNDMASKCGPKHEGLSALLRAMDCYRYGSRAQARDLLNTAAHSLGL